MAFRYLRHAAVIATSLHFTTAQQSNIVPEDLRSGFQGKGTEVQVSYTDEAVNGFKDGTSFNKDAVAQEPTFALGDSSGISPTTLYTLIMVDTTCPNKRVLHYARSNFKNNFDITNIATDTAPILDYKAPGSFGETGDNRQYSFLMYVNPQRKKIDNLQLPGEGETFDVKKFQTDNGLRDPTAGVGMVVKLGGQADCGGDSANTVPENLPSARPPRTSSANARPTAPAAGASSAAVTSASAAQPASSVANNSPATTSVPSNNTPGDDTENGPDSSSARTSGLVVATSVLQSGGLATSTVALSSASPDEGVGAGAGAGAGASRTPSASLVQQSTNAAPGMDNKGLGMIAPLFAVAGLIMW